MEGQDQSSEKAQFLKNSNTRSPTNPYLSFPNKFSSTSLSKIDSARSQLFVSTNAGDQASPLFEEAHGDPRATYVLSSYRHTQNGPAIHSHHLSGSNVTPFVNPNVHEHNQLNHVPGKGQPGNTHRKPEQIIQNSNELMQRNCLAKTYENNEGNLRNIPSFRSNSAFWMDDKSTNIPRRKSFNISGANRIRKHTDELELRTFKNVTTTSKTQQHSYILSSPINGVGNSASGTLPTSTYQTESNDMNSINLSQDKFCGSRSISRELWEDNRSNFANYKQPFEISGQDIISQVKYKLPRNASHVDFIMKTNEFNHPIDGCSKGKYRRFQNDSHLQDPRYIRRLKLAKIDEIIEIFVPVMRETWIRREFALKMVNLHKSISTENIESKNASVSLKRTTDELNLQDLLNHFSSLLASFVRFASSYPAFQDLCKEDQSELLKRNSLMFVMVR